MKAGFLAKVFGVESGYEAVDIETGEDVLKVFLTVKPERLVSPHCGGWEVFRKGKRRRELQLAPFGLRPISLAAEVPKLHCPGCAATFEVAPFCPGLRSAHLSTGIVHAAARPGDVPGGRGPFHRLGLGHGKGTGPEAPGGGFRPAGPARAALSVHRRDLRGQGAGVLHRGHQSGGRPGRVGGPGQGGRRAGAVLATAAAGRSDDPGRLLRPVGRLL